MTVLLEARGVQKSFAGIVAVHDLDVVVEAGETVGLIGPNGAGKTTFFNCLLGIHRSDHGVVMFDGRDISDLSVHQRVRRGIGRTFQRIELFGESTVREHLLIAERVRLGTGRLWKDLLGMGRVQPDEIRSCDEVLEMLGLAGLADEPIEHLSLGQCRLVEVGRALMTRPKLLLLDEPSSGLDRKETSDLAATLRNVQAERGFAILLVEHDVEFVSGFTERSYVLDFGVKIAEGPTKEVLRHPAVREAYLGTSAEEQ